jgi:hypothetical protein
MRKIITISFILLTLGLCGCATTLVLLGSSLAPGNSNNSSTTTTVPQPGSFSVQGTVNSGGLSTTDEVTVVLFTSKTNMQAVAFEACFISGGSFSYSVSTGEAGTYYLAAAYPSNNAQPLWAGGYGITSSGSLTQMSAALQPITLSSGNPHQTFNFTLYQVTGP